jgi:hypothetical protein
MILDQTILVKVLSNLLPMKRYPDKRKFDLSTIFIGILLFQLVVLTDCRNISDKKEKDSIGSRIRSMNTEEDFPRSITFRSFQNFDSTWGYTIFVNSRPFIHQKKIPVPKAVSGFQSKVDADIVAGIIIKMIQNGNLNPKISRKVIDSLGINIKTKK